MKWSGKRSAAGSLRAFKGGIEYFHIALLAQVAQPAVKERIHLLLEQNLLNARGDFFKVGIVSPALYWGTKVSM